MKENEINLVLTPEDMGGRFMSITDCPIFRALKRMGYEVSTVGGFTVGFGDLYIYGILDADNINRRINNKEENIQLTLFKMR